jgi:hypothetical protein
MQPSVLLPNTGLHFDKLRELDLEVGWLIEIGTKALAAYNQTTIHDAVTASGTYAYLETIRTLRDALCPRGWKPIRMHNLELTQHPDKDICILVSSGTEDTGKEHGHPMNKNPKGNKTMEVVSYNADQMRLPTMEYNFNTRKDQAIYWMLLYCVDVPKKEMRLELSFPIKMNFDELRIDGWLTRIILPSITFDPAPIVRSPGFAPEIPIEIKRRVNE